MNNISHYDHAKFIIGRFDHYLNIVNSKGTFYIALNTFLLGGLLTGVTALYKQLDHPIVLCLSIGVFILLSLISITLTIVAINPYLKSGNQSTPNRSLLFFGSVQEFDAVAHEVAFFLQDDGAKANDCVLQSWVLARGLVSKYKKLRIAGGLLIAQFGLLPFIIVCIINNIK